MSKRTRTFIAVEIAPEIRRRIVKLQASLAPSLADVKWVEPENIHVTLQFLGEVDESDLYKVCKTVERVTAGHAAFDMTVEGVGAFPNAQRPRVVWAGVGQGAAQLSAIRDALEKAFAGQGYACEDRSYTPHLTIGRIRRPVPHPNLGAALSQHERWQAGQMFVAETLVMASHLSPDGPHYVVMGRGRLGGQADES